MRDERDATRAFAISVSTVPKPLGATNRPDRERARAVSKAASTIHDAIEPLPCQPAEV